LDAKVVAPRCYEEVFVATIPKQHKDIFVQCKEIIVPEKDHVIQLPSGETKDLVSTNQFSSVGSNFSSFHDSNNNE
jgi:hypothetical protein